MRRYALRTGAGGGLAVVLATLGLVAAPSAASAEPTASADLNLFIGGSKVVKNAAIKQFRIQLSNQGPDVSQGIRVTIDASRIKQDVLAFGLPSGPDCDPAGPAKVTCFLGDLADGASLNDFPALFATTPKKQGNAGSFTVTVTSATADPDTSNNKTTVDVQAAPAGYDLAAVAYDVYADPIAKTPIAPGGTGELDWALYNEGSRAAKGIKFEIVLPSWTTFAERRSGCTYNDDNNHAVCTRPNRTVRPGEVFQMAKPMKVKVSPTAPGPMALGGGGVVGYGLADPTDEGGARASTVDDTVVRPAEAKDRERREADPGDNGAGFSVFASANSIDLAIGSTPAQGAVGAVVEVTFNVANNGPATGGARLRVKAPSGTLALKPAPGTFPTCLDGAGNWEFVEAAELRCTFESEFQPGRAFDFKLRFRIVSAPVAANGTIEVSNELPSPESKPADNTAAIIITVHGGSDGGGGGGLPVTGVQAGLIGGIGAAVVVAGVVLFLLARRRRVVLVTPADEESTD
ncbi:hypothetical protein GCM10027280_15520 [Micromonospora polyrhachis]|uniref:DUF11 domain-containing protein n=1 Tax=Micromonospora polyrhachis TaxID=1282883 RepID=A0A7W7WNV6_9ACTN|nr:DUF11 domain-containing protein [Micromonospora polyrhachis]MBB4958561.1 hypothetical protein [Micromonospora polyrhachis]